MKTTHEVHDLVQRLEAVLGEAEALFGALQADLRGDAAAICGEIANAVHDTRRKFTMQYRHLTEALQPHAEA